MSLRISFSHRPRRALAAGLTSLAVASLATVAPASGADEGVVQIVAIAPAFCRVTSAAHRPTLAAGAFANVRHACNTVNEAQITAQVSGLDGAALRLGGDDIAVSATGAVTFSPEQLAALSDLHAIGRQAGEPAPIVELTITPQ